MSKEDVSAATITLALINRSTRNLPASLASLGAASQVPVIPSIREGKRLLRAKYMKDPERRWPAYNMSPTLWA
jgi:hypothetical protein